MKHIAQCPAERAVYFLGGKWKIRIVFLLYQNKKNRFVELKKVQQTVTQQMLSKQLKELEIDGLINKKFFKLCRQKSNIPLQILELPLFQCVDHQTSGTEEIAELDQLD